jgi:nucleoside-diphosphate-sugar epimerase
MIRNETPSIYGDGFNTRDFIYVEDIVKANIISLTTNKNVFGHVFNVGTGNCKTINEVYNKIRELLKFNESPYFYPYRKGDIVDSCANINKSLNKLGFIAETNFKEGLLKTIEYYKKLNK